MNRLSIADMADMHIACGSANGNAIMADRLYDERFSSRYLPGHQRLRCVVSFKANRTAAGRHGRIHVENQEGDTATLR